MFLSLWLICLYRIYLQFLDLPDPATSWEQFDCDSSKWKRTELGKSKRYQVSFPLWDLCKSPSLPPDPGASLRFSLPQGCGGGWTACRTDWLGGRRGENWIAIHQSSACGAGKSIILCVRTHPLTTASQAGPCLSVSGLRSRIST